MPRTEELIKTLHPNAQAWARLFLDTVRKAGVLPEGYTVEIISGNRTWAEQDKLYAQGRFGNPGNIVTYARGGQSNHNFQIAWDIGIFHDGKYLGNSPLYAALGPIGEGIGLEWGGRWKKLQDTPHYQVHTGLSTGELRALVKAGKPVPVPTVEQFRGAVEKPTRKPVEVIDDCCPTKVPAFFEGGRVWVAVRPFVDRFGGEIEAVSGSTFTLTMHDEQIALSGIISEGTGYVKFADLNRVLEWGYIYESNRLTIKTKGA